MQYSSDSESRSDTSNRSINIRYADDVLSLHSSDGSDEEDSDFESDNECDWIAMVQILLEEEIKKKWDHQRLVWDRHVEKLLHENSFHKEYRMTLETFELLVSLLEPFVKPDLTKALNSCDEPIYPEIVVAMGIRWLAGGVWSDLKNVYEVSKSSFYRCRDKFLDAVICCNELDIKMPSTMEEWNEHKKRFTAKSSNNIMNGCVGAMDGMLQFIQCPSFEESNGNPRAYYSGHYQTTGLNVQAICDARLRFLFFAVVGPGNCSDSVAYGKTGLEAIIEALPPGTYIVADAAYSPTEHVLVPYTGSNRNDLDKDSYNFYLSQLRIRIEMAFGRLVGKWGFLQHRLKTSLVVSSKLLEVCARLHNFVINNDLEDDFDENDDDTFHGITAMRGSPLGEGYIPYTEELQNIPGTSMTRDIIVQHIRDCGYRRPNANLERRRRQELYDIGLM